MSYKPRRINPKAIKNLLRIMEPEKLKILNVTVHRDFKNKHITEISLHVYNDLLFFHEMTPGFGEAKKACIGDEWDKVARKLIPKPTPPPVKVSRLNKMFKVGKCFINNATGKRIQVTGIDEDKETVKMSAMVNHVSTPFSMSFDAVNKLLELPPGVIPTNDGAHMEHMKIKFIN